jgi:hypothetical protein
MVRAVTVESVRREVPQHDGCLRFDLGEGLLRDFDLVLHAGQALAEDLHRIGSRIIAPIEVNDHGCRVGTDGHAALVSKQVNGRANRVWRGAQFGRQFAVARQLFADLVVPRVETPPEDIGQLVPGT